MSFRRPSLTLLIHTESMSVRADFSGNRLVGIYQPDTSEISISDSLLGSVESILKLSTSRPARKIFLVSTEVWTQVVSLPRVNSELLSGEELNQSLRFEAESFSGIEALQSELDFVETKGNDQQRNFLVCQLPTATLASLEKLLESHSCTLVGASSPYANPTRLSEPADGPGMQRIEFWNHAVCCFNQSGLRRVAIANAEPKSERWIEILESSDFDLDQNTECLIEAGLGISSDFLPPTQHRLNDEETLSRWTEGWAQQIEQGAAPQIRTKIKPISQQTKLTGAFAFAAVILLACVGHYLYLRSQLDLMQKEITATETPRKKLKAAEQGQKKAAEQLEDLRGTLQSMQSENSVVKKLVANRNRISLLLQSISAQKSEEFVINGIETQNLGLVIQGESIAPEAANTLARALRKLLIQYGWEVQAPTQVGTNQLTNGGPWEFRILLVDVNLPDRAPDSLDVRQPFRNRTFVNLERKQPKSEGSVAK